MQQHRQVLPRQHQTLRPRQSSNGILWNDILVQPSSLAQCGNITLSWSGGVAPYTLVGNWWESSSGYSDSIARQWVIAQGLPDTTHLFTANVPVNSSLSIIAFDSSSRYSTPRSFQIDNSTPFGDGNCLYQHPEAVAASPGVLQEIYAASPTTITSTWAADYNPEPTSSSMTSSSSGSTRQLPYTIAPSRNYANGSSSSNSTIGFESGQYVDRSGTIAGLSISVGVLSLAFLILLFLHIRLTRRFKRLQRSQATVGKWTDARHELEERKESRDQIQEDSTWETFSSSIQAPEQLKLKNNTTQSYSGISLFSSGTSASRLSSFFENRSASRMGSNANADNQAATRQSTTSRASSATTSNPFEDYSEIASSSGHTDNNDYNHEQTSISKRYSRATTTLSDSHTIQSGRSHLSSAPSEQASTVGGVSAISDDHYHRRKACTISPATPTANTHGSGNDFLRPT